MFGTKYPFFPAKKACYMIHIWQVKHANWKAKAYILDCKSMMIVALLYVNVVKDDGFKVLNTLKISLDYLFCNFILSNKKNWFNKRKVC